MPIGNRKYKLAGIQRRSQTKPWLPTMRHWNHITANLFKGEVF
jgi:hypothetical protein